MDGVERAERVRGDECLCGRQRLAARVDQRPRTTLRSELFQDVRYVLLVERAISDTPPECAPQLDWRKS